MLLAGMQEKLDIKKNIFINVNKKSFQFKIEQQQKCNLCIITEQEYEKPLGRKYGSVIKFFICIAFNITQCRCKHDTFQFHHLTLFFLLAPKAGTSVGDDDNDESQQHICTDDACYCPRINPVARHGAVWQTQARGQ